MLLYLFKTNIAHTKQRTLNLVSFQQPQWYKLQTSYTPEKCQKWKLWTVKKDSKTKFTPNVRLSHSKCNDSFFKNRTFSLRTAKCIFIIVIYFHILLQMPVSNIEKKNTSQQGHQYTNKLKPQISSHVHLKKILFIKHK